MKKKPTFEEIKKQIQDVDTKGVYSEKDIEELAHILTD